MIKAWKRQSLGSRVFDTVNVLFILCLIAIFIIPFLNVIAISMSDYISISKGLVTVLPKGFTIESYGYVFRDSYLPRSYFNTILYAVGHTLFMLVVTSLFAYALSKKNFVASKIITVYIMITMFYNGGLIPTYMLINKLKLIDTLWVMIIPGCIDAFNVMIFRTFFKNVPEELSEAAYIEGAGEFRILFSIIVPLSKALFATFALFTIVGVWNSWFNAVLYLNDQNRFPLQLLLRNYLFMLTNEQLQGRAGVATRANPLMQRAIDPKGVRMAMVVITMFPIMVIYPFFQKYFMRGIMIGAIKG